MNKKISTLWGVVILLVIVLAVIGGMSVVSQCWQKANSETVLTLTPAPTPVDETAGWKTYRNEEYGFEFKYPENLFKTFKEYPDVERECHSSHFLYREYSSVVVLAAKGDEGDMAIEIVCTKEDDATMVNKLQDDFENGKFGMMSFDDLSKIKIGDEIGHSYSTFSLGYTTFWHQVKLGNNYLMIVDTTLSAPTGEPALGSIHDILSTFKFTKASTPTPTPTPAETTGWKTYRNTHLVNFAIKYPPYLGISEEQTVAQGTFVSFVKDNNEIFTVRRGIYYSPELGRQLSLEEFIESFSPDSRGYIVFGSNSYEGIKMRWKGSTCVFYQGTSNVLEICGDSSLPIEDFNKMLSTIEILEK